ncbi:MAG TPA: DUF4382 domain-containing protein [Steroidobacteraceae bacterium]|nr:DUF4382 domain-containing protein [Steroidobacteraceae bacterium]
MTAVRARLMRRLLWTSCALVLGGTALLASCSGYNNVTYGTAVVTMSDVSGDFTSYIVAIDVITLTRSDGVVVEPLAEPETVDLVKIHDLSELVEAPAVPVGTYTTLTLTLDYTAADISVNIGGVPTTASPLTTSGIAMTAATLTVAFDPSNQLVINSQECTRLAIDINLAASNTINFSASPLTVTVQPIMTATVAPEDQTVMRARGIFVIAQPSTSDFIVNMRPFIDLVSALGALTVTTTSTTYFNLDGVVFTGAAGLAAMQNLQISTPIVAYGTLGSFATITPGFNATAVYAGTSIENPLADFLTGTVSAVSGDTLNLHGASYVSRLGVPGYYADVPVTVGSSTIITEDGVAAGGLSTQSISVGQVVTLSGQSGTDAAGNLALDATGTASGAPPGTVRLQPTPVWGTLNSAVPGSLSLDVLSIGDFEPIALTFTGTGTSSANDAVPTSYAVNTPGIDESATAAGTLLQAYGFVTPYGSAPPDFTATSVTAGTAVPQTLVVEWENGGAASPFVSASSAGLVVDLTNANLSSTIEYIATGPTQTLLTALPASPTIAFAAGTTLTLAVGPVVVNSVDTIQVFNSASGFATALASALNGTNLVYRLVCVGQYSSDTNTFTATQVVVNL